MFLKLSACLMFLSAAAIANTPDSSCSKLAGYWLGTYEDIQDLFIHKPFPLMFYLTNKPDSKVIYGYTLKENDQLGPGFGKQHYPTLIWANCTDGTLSNLYFLPSGSHCADPLPKQDLSFKQQHLLLYIPWGNAMINTVLFANLVHPTNPPDINPKLLKEAEHAAENKIPTCH